MFKTNKKPKKSRKELKVINENMYKDAVLTEKSEFFMVEAYKSARTNLVYSLAKTEDKCKKIIFTSSVPSEGKTISCINTAISFGMTGNRVLIIDADLRKPKVDLCLKLDSKVGITNYMAGMSNLKDVIISDKEHHVDVIPVGHVPPNPSELLSSSKMEEMFNELSASYDYIFIDMPPVTVVTDAAIAAKHATGVLIVVRENYTDKALLEKTITNLKFADVNILGFLLNDVEKGKTSHYYYYEK